MLNKIVKAQKKLYQNLTLDSHKLLPKSQRSLKEALTQSAKGFILECKRSSPSQGQMIENYCVQSRAKLYEPFASAISVLTNKTFFDGRYEDLALVSQAVKVPVLCKDIIVAPFQVQLARQFGADAVLLMLNVLDDVTYQACAQLAHHYQMDVITEVHTFDELQRALALKASIIGINHRNFEDLSISFNPTYQLAPQIPKEIITISESGINTHADIQRLSGYSKNFLIGSILSKSTSPAHKIRQLRYGHIKVCGLTELEDAKSAYQAGALMGGLNFVPTSARYINVDKAQTLVTVPLLWIGVFKNHAIEAIVSISRQLNLFGVQLHGDESLAYIQSLRNQLPGTIKIIKAVTQETLCDYQHPIIDHCLLDSQTANQFGGTGLCVTLTPKVLNHAPNLFLAGGIGPDNIHDKLAYPFFGFDVNSQVESSPGRKCPIKLKQLFSNIDTFRRET